MRLAGIILLCSVLVAGAWTAQQFAAMQELAAMRGPAAEAFSPLDINGIAAWWDASDEATILLSGTSITNWLDKSGNARTAVQTTAAAQPTYVTNIIAGLNAASFDGGDTMTISSGIPCRSNATFFVVFNRPSSSLLGTAPFGDGGNKGYVLDWYNDNRMYVWLGTGSRFSAATTSTGLFVVAAGVDTSGSSVWLRRNAVGVGLGSVTVSAPNPLQTIGYSGGTFHKSYLCEVIAYTNSLGTGDVARIENHLMNKWGL